MIPDGCVNFAFLGQFADTPRDTVFTTEYSVRTAMEAVYGLLGVDRGVPEVWGSVYDIRELLHSTVCLMDGRWRSGGPSSKRSCGIRTCFGTACDRWVLPFCVLKTEETTITQNTFIPNRGLLLKDHCPS